MRVMQRDETTVGPVAVGGNTITLVAHTRALRVGNPGGGALFVRASPSHVEVLDEHGERRTVRIHDIERMVVVAIAVVTIGYAVGVRLLPRKNRTAR